MLANEATKLIHGEAEAHKARAGAQAVFGIAGAAGGQGGAMDDVPTTKLAQDATARWPGSRFRRCECEHNLP